MKKVQEWKCGKKHDKKVKKTSESKVKKEEVKEDGK